VQLLQEYWKRFLPKNIGTARHEFPRGALEYAEGPKVGFHSNGQRPGKAAKMAFDQGTVFVLGAGFTKAFLSESPLLVDKYGGRELEARFRSFPTAHAILQMELDHHDHPQGWINIERLMTRLSGGMPYDSETEAKNEFGLLLSELKQSFIRRIEEARQAQKGEQAGLLNFARHCAKNHVNCITFNYDDVLDEALWRCWPVNAPVAWSPDWGYGFPCKMSEDAVREVRSQFESTGPMLLLKLHGSVNWRIPLGYRGTRAVEAFRHHEPWFQHPGPEKVPLKQIEPFLEPEPFMVPPVLTKAELIEQPILRLTWSLAIDALKKSERIVFIGYSLPVTDIAASFLFREGLRDLDVTQITVVSKVSDGDEGDQAARLMKAYQEVFPGIKPAQFDFSGAENWTFNNLPWWLYDSHGQAIAFGFGKHVMSRSGAFIGTCIDGPIVWARHTDGQGIYAGNIEGDRLFFREDTKSERKYQEIILQPPVGIPTSQPASLNQLQLQPGYKDFEVNK
jgi:hypothetical protein